MTENTVPQSLNWVQARANCSIHSIFKALEQGAREDIAEIESLLTAHDETKFSVVASSRQFSVIRVSDPMTSASESVDVRCQRDDITVHRANTSGEELMFTATLTLNNEGRCKLKVNGVEMEQWQVRRMALEALLFRS